MNTLGGKDALKILTSAYQGEVLDVPDPYGIMDDNKIEEEERDDLDVNVDDLPEIKNFIKRFSFATKGGFNKFDRAKRAKMGLQSKNQDAFVVESTVLDLNHCHLYAVIDGHGIAGFETANKIEKRLPYHVNEELRQALVIVEDGLDLKK